MLKSVPTTLSIGLPSAFVLVAAVAVVVAIAASPLPAAEGGLTTMTASPPTLVAGHVDGPVKIDGELSEAAWQAAKPAGGFTLLLETSTKAQ